MTTLSEHWLWLVPLRKFDNLHSNYTGFGRLDKQLSDDSNISPGYCGMALILRISVGKFSLKVESVVFS